MKLVKVLIAATIMMGSVKFSEAQLVKKTAVEEKRNEPTCLEVVAKPTYENRAVKGCTLKLFSGSTLLETIDETDRKKHIFILRRNAEYILEISRQGHVTRSVFFNTYLPKKIRTKPVFTFEYRVELPKMVAGADDYMFEFPVALVSYIEENERFEYNKEYTTFIKMEVDKALKPSQMVTK